ncbi:MAG TPA: VOC family protein [Janthinobacterium sp.]|nr:VOC family protein [Janthinobacterium sp.]
MPVSRLDHITIPAASLESGIDYVHRALGVVPQAGGRHARMGTHNCLLKLGEKLYLEVIAVDPAAPAPQRPRWFRLDAAESAGPPRLAAWVARTDDIAAAVAASALALGDIEPMARAALRWLITIPGDGGLPLGGAAPLLIEWQTTPHPAAGMADSGCTLLGLEIIHDDAEQVRAMLARIGFQGPVRVLPAAAGQAPHLLAHIQTPDGPRRLGGPVPP